MGSKASRLAERGATLVEFVIAAPFVLLLGLATVQAGLIYHGKTTLNYATFEAARTGAVHNAQLAAMREELGFRLAPLQGGDGSLEKATLAVTKSLLSVKDTSTTRLQIINPTAAAFDDWAVFSGESNRRVIPNSHLRHRNYKTGATSGLSLRDANLLKIKVTHGLDLKVPFVNTILAKSLAIIDPGNAAFFYSRNKIPIRSVATVRMQSEAWEGEILAASAAPPVDTVGAAPEVLVAAEGKLPPAEADESARAVDCQENYGLGSSPVLIDAGAYESGVCTTADLGYTSPDVPENQSQTDTGDRGC